jgi:DNA-binding IclR family transcriptional regulator
MTDSPDAAEAGSQTLARGLIVLTLIGESPSPLTAAEVAARLGLHRSMAYRLIRTLEAHGFVVRTASGHLELGVRLVALSRNVARGLQAAAAPVLADLANDLNMTAFVVAFDGEAAVTLYTAEPHGPDATVAQRPGSRHPIDRGAPGRVIRSQVDPISHPPKRYEVSRDEVILGLSSVAVPLRLPDGRPSSLAVVYLTQEDDVESLAGSLSAAAQLIERALD